MKQKRYYIRECDHTWYWDVNAGNSDALCNEDSSDIHCSPCDEKWTCRFANFPAQLKRKRTYKLRIFPPDNFNFYETLINNRKKKRNTDLCLKCAYNNHYENIWLNSKELRKVKLTQLNREI